MMQRLPTNHVEPKAKRAKWKRCFIMRYQYNYSEPCTLERTRIKLDSCRVTVTIVSESQ